MGIPQGEFRKAKPPSFDVTDVAGLVVEAWILVKERYFKIHDYTKNEKARIIIFNLNSRDLVWWERLVQVRGIIERRINWIQFWVYFQEKYLTT